MLPSKQTPTSAWLLKWILIWNTSRDLFYRFHLARRARCFEYFGSTGIHAMKQWNAISKQKHSMTAMPLSRWLVARLCMAKNGDHRCLHCFLCQLPQVMISFDLLAEPCCPIIELHTWAGPILPQQAGMGFQQDHMVFWGLFSLDQFCKDRCGHHGGWLKQCSPSR